MSTERSQFKEDPKLGRLREAVVEQYDLLYPGYWERTGFKALGLKKLGGLLNLVSQARCDTCHSRADRYQIQVVHPNRPTEKPDLPLVPVIPPKLWQWVEGKICRKCPDTRLIVMERIQDYFAAGNRLVSEVKISV